MNIHVTNCLFITIIIYIPKQRKKCNVYVNNKCQLKKLFTETATLKNLTLKLSSEYLIIKKIKSCSKGLS